MKRAITYIIILIFSCTSLFAHSGKARYHALIEMDNTVSSMNALTLVLANTDIEVLALLVNDSSTKEEVSAYLKSFYHDGIPVFDISNKEKAEIINKEIFENEPDSITYISFAELGNNPYLSSQNRELLRLKEIFIYTDGEAFSKQDRGIIYFFTGNNIPVYVVGGQRELSELNVDATCNPYAKQIISQLQESKIKCEKEIIPLFIKDSTKFIHAPTKNNLTKVYVYNGNNQDFAELLKTAITPDLTKENKVFASFPTDKNMFSEDVQQIMDDDMLKHGFSEWRACVITNELHGHLGIYAAVGAKMGIRVREYFRVGVDDIRITSYAGSTPPFSCLNDGLQVGTGGTVGHGLIEVAEITKPKPAATFRFKNQTVNMELKPEYWDQIKQDISFAVKTYGLGTENYWAYVRKLALKYWHDWDRHHIFIIN